MVFTYFIVELRRNHVAELLAVKFHASPPRLFDSFEDSKLDLWKRF
jgi:hypothetical protein